MKIPEQRGLNVKIDELMNLKIRPIFLIAAWVLTQHEFARGENSLLATAWNQFEAGRFCGQTTEKDIVDAGFSCFDRNKDFHRGWYMNTSSDILQWLIFDEAAKRHLEQTKCLRDRLVEIHKSEDAQFSWTTMLTSAWLGYKKAQLSLAICDRFIFSPVAQQNAPPSEGAIEKYKAICQNPDKMEALRGARDIFKQNIPVFGSDEALDFFETHRNSLVSEKTGKPISDREILESDFTTLEAFPIDFDKIQPDLKKLLWKSLGEKALEASRLYKARSPDGSFNLSKKQRDDLYEAGVVAEVMRDRSLIHPNQAGEVTLKKKETVSAGAVCILSKYEPNLKAEIAEFILWSLIIGAPYMRVAQGIRLAETLSSSKLALSAFGRGSTVLQLVNGSVEGFKTCVLRRVSKKVKKAGETQLTMDVKAIKGLTKDYGYQPFNLEIPTPKTCKSLENPNFLEDQLHQSECLKNLAIVAITVALETR